MRTPAQRRSGIPAAAALLLAALLATACKPAPSEAELKARDEAIARSVQQALDEERSKDRQLREQARADAHRMMPADTSVETPPAGPGAAAGVASARAAIEARDTAPFLERIKRALLNPDTMEIRDASLRENGTAFCAEVNMKKRSGAMSGFTPVIVTADRMLFHLGATDALDPRETIDPAEFLKLNLQVRCWIVAAPGK